MPVNRKQFMQSLGAECDNWTWSWSFINHDDQLVIFGAWDTENEQERSVILRESWEYNQSRGGVRRQPGYIQAIRHLRFVDEGYELFTFNMTHGTGDSDPGLSRIENFERLIRKRYLKKEGDIWYAYFSPNLYPDELTTSEGYAEGARKQILVNAYERDPAARRECLLHHGYDCQGCGFSFEKVYGELGRQFIHVHHIRPLHTVGDGYRLNALTDLIPLCPNCHAMVHRTCPVMDIDTLRAFHSKRHVPGTDS
ncbi:HNH endonuclease [Pantoea agglomerans]